MEFKELDKGKGILLLSLVLLALYFPFFLHLDALPIQQWDEALFAFRAHHIAEYLSPLENFGFYDTLDSFPNTKPPLFSYIQALSYKIFGYTELALRLPVAISGVISCLLFIYFFNKDFKDYYAGIFAALVLATSTGFVNLHMARTGDHDVPFALSAFLFVYLFYRFLQNRKVKTLVFSLFWFLCAFFIKSIAIFLVLPGIIIFILWQKNTREKIKKNLHWILPSVIVLGTAIFLMLYLIKGAHTLGVDNYQRLFVVTDEYHRHYFWFYFDVWNVKGQFRPWILFLPLSILPILFDSKLKPFLLYLWTISAAQWFILSLAQTKIPHYAAPIFIIHAVIVGFTISWLFRYASIYMKNRFQVSSYRFLLVFLILLFAFPYYNIIDHIYLRKEKDPRQLPSLFLKENPEYKKTIVVHEGINGSNAFYTYIRNNHKGYSMRKMEKIDASIKAKRAIISCDEEELIKLEQMFDVKVIEDQYDCKMLWLEAKKPKARQASKIN